MKNFKNKIIKNCEVVYVDNLEALNFLFSHNLSKNCKIRSLSPNVLSQRVNVEDIDKLISKNKYSFIANKSQHMISALIYSCYDIYKDWNLSTALGQLAFNNLRLLMRAASLKKSDFNKKICIVNIETDNIFVNKRIQSPWVKLLENNSNVDTIKYNVDLPKNNAYNFEKNISIFNKLTFASKEKFIYQMGRIFSKLSNNNFPSGNIFSFSSNDYAKEVAGYFFLRKWNIINQEPMIKNKKVNINKNDIDSIISNAFKPFADQVCCEQASIAIQKDLRLKAYDGFKKYFNVKKNYSLKLKRKNSIIFLGHSKNFVNAAICSKFSNLKIPVVLFQHGLDKEITHRLEKQRICDENVLANLVVCYNKYQKQCLKSNPFALKNSNSFVGGCPKEYFNFNKKNYKYDSFLYVSSFLPRGYVQNTFDNVGDYDYTIQEISFIKGVLSEANKHITYKTYPSIRYVDTDLVRQEIQKYKNIRIFDTNIDGRYLYSKYRLIITSKATSTLGWVIAANRPVIYIDPQNEDDRIHKKLRRLFKKNLFFFDKREANWDKKLLEFLQKPIDDIEKIYFKKNTGELINNLLPKVKYESIYKQIVSKVNRSKIEINF